MQEDTLIPFTRSIQEFEGLQHHMSTTESRSLASRSCLLALCRILGSDVPPEDRRASYGIQCKNYCHKQRGPRRNGVWKLVAELHCPWRVVHDPLPCLEGFLSSAPTADRYYQNKSPHHKQAPFIDTIMF